MKVFEVLPSELIFMASYLGADEFFGLQNPFFGMSEKETQSALADAQSSLAEKKYASLDFDGNFTPVESIELMSEVCSHCDSYITVDVMEKGIEQAPVRFYFLDNYTVRLSGTDMLRLELVSSDEIEAELLDLSDKYAPHTCDISQEPFLIPLSTLAKAQLVSDELEKQREYLTELKCPDIFTEILVSGFKRETNYCAVTLVDFTTKKVDSVICLQSGDKTLRMVSIKENDVNCWELSLMDSSVMKNALSIMIKDPLEQLKEGGDDDALS